MDHWGLYDVAQEKHLERLRAAEKERLIRSLDAGNRMNHVDPGYVSRRILAPMGRLLIALGNFLQSRAVPLDQPAIKAQSD